MSERVQKVVSSVFLVIKIQVAGVYFHACVAKMKVSEWVDGTANYYWFNNNYFGAAEPVKTFLNYVLATPYVSFLTWSVLAVELALAIAILMSPKYKFFALVIGVFFHILILLLMGIASFAIAMIGALCLYLLDDALLYYHATRGGGVRDESLQVAN